MNRTRHILRDLRRDLVKNRWIYIMAIPVIAFYILFSYIPMAGVQIAFKDYNFGAGIWGSPWAGLKHFIAFFSLSHKRPTFAFTGESGYTLAFANRIAHSGSHAETGGVLGGGGITTLGPFRTFTNIPGPGVRTAYFAAFGSWPGVLQKNAESHRDSDALMRVAVPRRRGPAGLHSFVAAAHSARFSGISQTGAGSV